MKFTIPFLFSFVLASFASAAEVVNFSLSTEISNCSISRNYRKNALTCAPKKISSQAVSVELTALSEKVQAGTEFLTISDNGLTYNVVLNVQKILNGSEAYYVVSPIISVLSTVDSYNTTYPGEQFVAQSIQDLNPIEVIAKPVIRGTQADYLKITLNSK